MNDHNLDDLIIDNFEPKNSKTKSFLTIIALIIVVLIVAIIFTKIILKDPNADQEVFEENNTELISPELTLQSASTPKAEEIKKEEPELSNIIEKALNAPAPAPEPAEEIAKETVEVTKEVIKVPEPPKVEEDTKEEERLQKEREYEEIKKSRLEQENAAREKASQEQAEQERIAKEKAAVKSVPTPVKPKPATSNSRVSGAYFIQVGSFSKTPSKQFLSIIKKSGFNYKITAKAANGTKKLLIGPYKTRSSAHGALVRVKDRINKNAFVVKK